jgi:hypothetical protein
VTLVVSSMTPAPPAEVQESVERIRGPWSGTPEAQDH